jgi:hypothetical protein
MMPTADQHLLLHRMLPISDTDTLVAPVVQLRLDDACLASVIFPNTHQVPAVRCSTVEILMASLCPDSLPLRLGTVPDMSGLHYYYPNIAKSYRLRVPRRSPRAKRRLCANCRNRRAVVHAVESGTDAEKSAELERWR